MIVMMDGRAFDANWKAVVSLQPSFARNVKSTFALCPAKAHENETASKSSIYWKRINYLLLIIKTQNKIEKIVFSLVGVISLKFFFIILKYVQIDSMHILNFEFIDDQSNFTRAKRSAVFIISFSIGVMIADKFGDAVGAGLDLKGVECSIIFAGINPVPSLVTCADIHSMAVVFVISSQSI